MGLRTIFPARTIKCLARWDAGGEKIPGAAAAITILMSSSANLHFKGCPEFLFGARTRLGDQHKTMNMYGLLMFTFLIFSFVEGKKFD